MPSEKQRRMLLEPLLERRADLAYRNRFLFFRPVGHYWRAVYFWKTRGKVSLLSFVFPLFAGKFVSFIWGEGMAPDSNHLLQISWDDPERAALECSDFIERSVLPCIADIVYPEELAKHPRYCNDILDPLFRACFYGDFDEAERRAVGYVDWWGPTNSFYSEEKKMFVHEPYSIELVTEHHRMSDDAAWRMAYLAQLLRTNRAEVPTLLHEWERHTAKGFGIEEYWAPTAFPCER